MREIKFRAWFKDTDDMVEWEELMGFKGLADLLNDAKNDYPSVKVMQYTGLKDVHGREIWEGDILQAFYGKDNKPWAKTRVFFNEEGYWGSESSSGKEKVCYAGFYKCEVIGNIYENPSLLKSGDPA